MKNNVLLLAIIVIIIISAGFQACSPEQQQTYTVEFSSSWVSLEGASNARSLIFQSGGKSNPNVILRAGELSGLTDSDMKLLSESYQLSHIIDLRDEVEVESAPDPVIEGAQYHRMNVWRRAVRLRNIQESTVDGTLDSELFVRNYYTVFAFDPSAIEAYRNMFGILAENEGGGVLIHCTHGKDRTGVALTLILYALGVEWEDIEREYLMSNNTDITPLRYYREIIEEKYGGMENYLETEMELDEDKITVLKEKYTNITKYN